MVSWTGKINIPLSPCVPEILVSRDGFSRPVPRQSAHLHTQAESGAYSRDFSRFPRRRPFIYTAIRPIGSVTSGSGQAIAYRWRSLSRVRRHRASISPKGSSSNGCCLFFTMDQLVYTPLFSFPHPLLVRVRSGYRVLKVPASYQQSNQLRVFSKPFYERCQFMTFEPTLCSSDFFLSSRPRTGFATTYITGYG